MWPQLTLYKLDFLEHLSAKGEFSDALRLAEYLLLQGLSCSFSSSLHHSVSTVVQSSISKSKRPNKARMVRYAASSFHGVT